MDVIVRLRITSGKRERHAVCENCLSVKKESCGGVYHAAHFLCHHRAIAEIVVPFFLTGISSGANGKQVEGSVYSQQASGGSRLHSSQLMQNIRKS